MALESVFGTPPPIVGAANNHTLKHDGEKQREGGISDGSDAEKEEGEIEDGEIVDSQDEGGAADDKEEAIVRPSGTTGFDIMGMLQRDLENGVEDGGTGMKRKKKKKKKRKRPLMLLQGGEGGQATGPDTAAPLPSKPKKHKRYVDHDRIEDEDDVWLSHGAAFPRRHNPTDLTNNLPQSPPLLPKQRSPSKSPPPPGLYDSPPESSDEYDGPPNRGGPYGRFAMSSPNMEALGGDFRSRKGMKRRRGGDKRGKGRSKGRRKEPQRQVCKFYLDGKCSKGPECTYSHDSPLIKKQELCKFYLNGFCAKSETCVFMHKEFPCKFFHTGAKCYSAEKCKFSHDPLTDEMKHVLQKYLEKEDDPNGSDEDLPPKPHRPSLLGSPPRHIKEMVAHEALKKIPSLFDIEVQPPQNIMPPGNNQLPPQQQPPMRPNFYSEAMGSPGPPCPRPALLPFPTSSFDPDQNDFMFDGDDMGPSMGPGFGPMGPHCGNGIHFGSPNRMMPYGNPHQQGVEPPMMDIDDRFPPMEDMMYQQDEDEEMGNMMDQQGPMHPNNERLPFHPIPWRNLAIADVDMRHGPSGEDDQLEEYDRGELGNERDTSQSSESESEANKASDGSTGGSILIPLHLPKKQRELFLRIQQQQRQAGSSQEDSDKGEGKKKEDKQEEMAEEQEEETVFQESVGKEEDEEEMAIKKAEKEGWYSSSEEDDDDEDKPLTAVLKKLQQEPITKPAVPQPTPPVFNIAQMLQSIAGVNPPAADGKPPVLPKPDPRRDPRAQRHAELRDPRSTRNGINPEVKDPRVRTRFDPRLLPSSANVELPRFGSLHASTGHNRDANFADSKFPIVKEQRRAPLLPTPGSIRPDTEATEIPKMAHHPIPYRLHAVAVPHPNYSSLLQFGRANPKLLQSDPRLKRRLAPERRPSSESAQHEPKSKAPSLVANAKSGSRVTGLELESRKDCILRSSFGGNASTSSPPRQPDIPQLHDSDQVQEPDKIQESVKIKESDNIKEPEPDNVQVQEPDNIHENDTDKTESIVSTVASPDRPPPETQSHPNGKYISFIDLNDDSDSDDNDLVIVETKADEPETNDGESNKSDDLVVVETKSATPKESDEPPKANVVGDSNRCDEVVAVEMKKAPPKKTSAGGESKKSNELVIVETKKAPPKKANEPLKTNASGKSNKSGGLATAKTKKAAPKKAAPKTCKRVAAKPSDECIVTGVKLVVKKPRLVALKRKTEVEYLSPLDTANADNDSKRQLRSPKKTANSPKNVPKNPKGAAKSPKSATKSPKGNSKNSSKKESPKTKSKPSSKHSEKSGSKEASKVPKIILNVSPQKIVSRPAIPKLVLKKVGQTVIKSTLVPSDIPSPMERTNSLSPPSGNDLQSLSPEQDANDDDNTCLKDIFKTIDPTASPFC